MQLVKKAYSQHAYITNIYFIVCLSGNPRSLDLFTTVKNYCLKTKMTAQLHQISTKEEFNNALNKIKAEVKLSEVRPLIHFDGHGSERGLKIPSGAVIRWSNLGQRLEYINMKCKNSLLLTFATCYGNHLCNFFDNKYFNPSTSRSPAYGIFAPYNEVQEGEVEDSYERFYKKLLNESNLSDAVKELQKSALFEIRFSDMIFLMICRFMTEFQYKRIYRSETQFNAYLNELGRIYSLKSGILPTEKEYNILASHLNDKTNLLNYFKAIRNNFFMIDMYPENDKLFSRIEEKDIQGWKSY